MNAGRFSPVGVFGGTFDPIHYGHLRSALELSESLALEQLHFMPCAIPPHRELPGCSPEQRAAMVELAVAGEARLLCDSRELQRPGISFTIDSLIELRQELADDKSLSLIMGCDALLKITSWHRWEELLDWAHVIIIARPGWHLPANGPIAEWVKSHSLGADADITERAGGGILIKELRPLAISSTEIRVILAAGRSARYLMPEPVLDYIYSHNLYNAPPI